MRLHDLLASSLIGNRASIALESDSDSGVRQWTFGDLDDSANRVARALRAAGVARGDRVCVWLPNSVSFIHIFLATLRLGAVFVPINILYRDRELLHIIRDSDPALVVIDNDTSVSIPGEFPAVTASELEQRAGTFSADPPHIAVGADDPALIIYTSGTTGRAKGALLTHDNLCANTVNLVSSWRITSDDRYLAVLPLFHVHGLANGALCWLASGCRMRLVTKFESASAAALFESFKPTLFYGVPTVYVRLLALDPSAASDIGSTMRLFVSGSAPLPAGVFTDFEQRFGHTILERYGMTETLMTLSNPYAGERRRGSVGLPLPGISARIVDSELQDVPDGQSGELLVRGPTVFPGYWRQPEATAAAFADGWFRTGDIAVRAADGYYTLEGRRGDVIISAGFNIYPREIEDTLLELPGVREVAVVARRDDVRGEVPVAWIVSDAELPAELLESHCRQQLARFKVPRAFIRVEALPRNALGKVQKHLLVERSRT
ncbi:MAG: class I adenylate-forming enzyme family protein [Gemmatimonadota bacterium]